MQEIDRTPASGLRAEPAKPAGQVLVED